MRRRQWGGARTFRTVSIEKAGVGQRTQGSFAFYALPFLLARELSKNRLNQGKGVVANVMQTTWEGYANKAIYMDKPIPSQRERCELSSRVGV